MSAADFETAGLEKLTDPQLLNALEKIVLGGRRRMAELLRHLAEVEDRRLHLKAGYGSLFSYCLIRWKMSEDEACRRIEVARLGRTFPLIFKMLASGEVTLTVVALLKPYLRQENHADLLIAVSNLSTRAAQEVLAARFPKPDAPSLVRKLPEGRRSLAAASSRLSNSGASSASATMQRETRPASQTQRGCVIDGESGAVEDTRRSAWVSSSKDAAEQAQPWFAGAVATSACLSSKPLAQQERPSLAGAAASAHCVGNAQSASNQLDDGGAGVHRGRRARVEALSEGRYRVQFTAGTQLKKKLELARDLMRHRNPSGEIAVVVERALDSLLAELERNRFGATSKPREKRKATGQGISRHARREVVLRDGLACSFTDERGRRCGSRAFLEYDHENPRGKGGSSDVENLRLLCRAHNRLAAELEYGRQTVEAAVNRRHERRKAPESLAVRDISSARLGHQRTNSRPVAILVAASRTLALLCTPACSLHAPKAATPYSTAGVGTQTKVRGADESRLAF